MKPTAFERSHRSERGRQRPQQAAKVRWRGIPLARLQSGRCYARDEHAPKPGAWPWLNERASVLKCAVCGVLAAILLVLGLGAVPANADQPSIYLIELYRTNQVLVHFFTDPNFTYELQYANAVGTNGKFIWMTLYTAPNLPFPSHYIIVDTRTDRFRFYRLKVSPYALG